MNDGERILGAGKPAPFSRREYLRKYLGRYLMIFDTNEDKNEDKNFIVGKLWVRLEILYHPCYTITRYKTRKTKV